jgi:hypothetical protein
MAEFAATTEMQKIKPLADDFYQKILFDEEPLFVSDEATLFGVCMGEIDEVLRRISEAYGVPVAIEDGRLPLWKLITLLNSRGPDQD